MHAQTKNALEDRAAQAEPATGSSATLMRQKWKNLLFIHWRYDCEAIQRTLPPGLTTDTFNGEAYLGIVPFEMEDVHPAWFPSFRPVSNFSELNLRTYVRDEKGRSGVWFYSLDAGAWLAVALARQFFHLPYVRSDFEIERYGNQQRYQVTRRDKNLAEKTCTYTYELPSETYLPAGARSLEAFLVERYRLFSYSARKKVLHTGTVSHDPYGVAAAQLLSCDSHLFSWNGLVPPNEAPASVLFSPGVNVSIHRLEVA